MEDIFGPRTNEVKARLAQVQVLTLDQLEALGVTWCIAWGAVGFHEDILDDLAHMATRADLTGRRAQARAAMRLPLACPSGATDAAVDAVDFELLADHLGDPHYRLLSAPLDFVVHLPPWWSEPGSRRLFLELLEANGFASSSEVVTRLS